MCITAHTVSNVVARHMQFSATMVADFSVTASEELVMTVAFVF